jgi:hypothetical protein
MLLYLLLGFKTFSDTYISNACIALRFLNPGNVWRGMVSLAFTGLDVSALISVAASRVTREST